MPPTKDIPVAVAVRMRASGGSEESRKNLRDLDIESSGEEERGVVFLFTHPRNLQVTKRDPLGDEEQVIVPIDGFMLDPANDWGLKHWVLMVPAPS